MNIQQLKDYNWWASDSRPIELGLSSLISRLTSSVGKLVIGLDSDKSLVQKVESQLA